MIKQKNASVMIIFVIIFAILIIALLATVFILLNRNNNIIYGANNTIINHSQYNNQINPVNGKEVVNANNLFAMDLYSKYKNNDGNLFYSPYSISSALTMTYEGAKGQTAQEMQSVLHLPENKEILRSGYITVNSGLNKEGKKYKLNTANALWAQKDYPFIDDYFNLVDNYYGGKVTNLDFVKETEKSRITINKWVEDKTNDKIKDLIPKGILTSDTRLVLTNAIYFNANWTHKFKDYATYDQDFKTKNGIVKVPTMHQTNEFNYGENSELKILEMDYLGDDISMIIILPNEDDLSNLEQVLSYSKLEEWKDDMKKEEVEVSLPKFKFETKYFMNEDLKQMGMVNAFDGAKADFSGMWIKQRDENLYISQVIHQAFINVSESGTEAAAATAVVMAEATSEPPPVKNIKEFKADHPFIFIIQQKESGNILFMGKVVDPTKL